MTNSVIETEASEKQNSLNDMRGKQWIRFTKSWFILNPAARRDKIVHPATFPETLAAEFIKFFTKKWQWVLDPFAGSGSTLIAAKGLRRNSIGVELYSVYAALARRRLDQIQDSKTEHIIVKADSRELVRLFEEHELPKVNFCVTSPPYWNQLKKTSERQKARTARYMNTNYGRNVNDISRIENYGDFLKQLELVFDNVYEVMVDGSYLVVVVNNTYANGRVWPLAFDTFDILSKKWVPKDEKIWCQDNKKLFPFGMFHSWIGNRSHHYCLIFKK